MNKRFFITFFMYFFVVQSLIFGVVWSEPKFYAIGLINLVFIILMVLFYKHFDTTAVSEAKKQKSEQHAEYSAHAYHPSLHGSKKSQSPSVMGYVFLLSIFLLFLVVVDKSFFGIFSISVRWFAAFYFIMLFLSAKKLLDKKILIGDSVFLPRDFLFWTSLIVVMGAYGTLALHVLAFKLILSVLIGFIFFFIGARIVKDIGSSNIFKLFFTRFYLVLLLVLLAWITLQSSFGTYGSKLSQDRQNIQAMVTKRFGGSVDQHVGVLDFTGVDLLSNGQGQVLSSSLSTGSTSSGNLSTGSASSELASGMVVSDILSSDTSIATGDITEEPSVQIQDDDRLQLPTLPTLMDVLIYLMNHYNVPLSVKKDITFLYVTPKNPYYAQFRTAYDMQLIGKVANPSKQVLCQTYMVMKGLVEEWDVPEALDIKTAYWNAATSKGSLGGCKWNFYVKNINL